MDCKTSEEFVPNPGKSPSFLGIPLQESLAISSAFLQEMAVGSRNVDIFNTNNMQNEQSTF